LLLTCCWGLSSPQGCALSSNVIKLQVDPASGKLGTEVAVRQPWLEVGGWALPQLPPLITDILISLDDKWLFFSNWLRGERRGGGT
jgi:selenium-binding protein 1